MSIFSNEKPQPYDLSQFSILLVEDSSYMQALLTSMMKVFGVGDIMVCDGAEEAIELLKVTQASKKSRYITDIDIIITDWLMPKGSGRDLIEWVRSNSSDMVHFLPIVVVSAYTTEKVISRARDCGANEAMVKPLSGTDLASRICSVIDNPRTFVRAPGYFGPDRRRQDLFFSGKEQRVMDPKFIQIVRNDGRE